MVTMDLMPFIKTGKSEEKRESKREMAAEKKNPRLEKKEKVHQKPKKRR